MIHVRRRPHGSTITALLTVDHLNLRALLDLAEEARTARDAGRLLREIGRRLAVHELVEDHILMPAVIAARDTISPMVRLRSARAHQDVRVAFARLSDLAEAGFEARVHGFVARLRDHLTEEDKGVFMLARKVLPAERLRALGRQMLALRGGPAD